MIFIKTLAALRAPPVALTNCFTFASSSQNNSFSELSEDSMVQLFTAVEKLPDELL